jgi:hypothetical protein
MGPHAAMFLLYTLYEQYVHVSNTKKCKVRK